MEYEIDIERLRKDLIDNFGAAMYFCPIVVIDLVEVENASDERLLEIAQNNHIDLNRYIIENNNTYSKKLKYN